MVHLRDSWRDFPRVQVDSSCGQGPRSVFEGVTMITKIWDFERYSEEHGNVSLVCSERLQSALRVGGQRPQSPSVSRRIRRVSADLPLSSLHVMRVSLVQLHLSVSLIFTNF